MSMIKATGIETEYGIMITGKKALDPFNASKLLFDAYGRSRHVAVPYGSNHRSAENQQEPVPHEATDLMLANGARFYIDHAHPEYSTPECVSPRTLVAADKAGERILDACRQVVEAAGILPHGRLMLFKNNSDHRGNSYGCHENYLLTKDLFVRLSDRKSNRLNRGFLPFLISRIIICGAGKVGSENNRSPVGFQLSQRADFMETLMGLQTTYNRPLFNTRDEPHADSARFRRLHVIAGDANMAEYSTYLKVGITQLVLSMLEDDFFKSDLQPADPIQAVQTVSRDLSFKKPILLKNGRYMTACDIQRIYCEQAGRYLEAEKKSDRFGKVHQIWQDVLSCFPDQSDRLSSLLDWAIKKRILERFLRMEKVDWQETAAWQPVIEASMDHVRRYETTSPEEAPTLTIDKGNRAGKQAVILAEKAGLNIDDFDKQRKLFFKLRRLDLEYHDIRRQNGETKGIFYQLQDQGLVERVVTDQEIDQAVVLPPDQTRAFVRGQTIARHADRIACADWDVIRFIKPAEDSDDKRLLNLTDPLMEGKIKQELEHY